MFAMGLICARLNYLPKVRTVSPKPTYDRPTVAFRVEVPKTAPDSPDAWRWYRLKGVPAGCEYIYSARDLRRAVLVYGATAAEYLKPTTHPRFRIIARGLITGRFLAEYVWTWRPIVGRYEPPTEPLIVWPATHELPPEVVRGALATRQALGSTHEDHLGY